MTTTRTRSRDLDEAKAMVKVYRDRWFATREWLNDAPTTDAARAAEPFERAAYMALCRAKQHVRRLEALEAGETR